MANYQQEARNWAKSWTDYHHKVKDYTGYSIVEAWKGNRKINAWIDKDGHETAKVGGEGCTNETVGELKEWLDAEQKHLRKRDRV
jgi:hypothetical protein